MRYVKVESTNSGFTLDHQNYLTWLNVHADSLPPGAQAFALDSEHYNFTHQWCPRGATFDRLLIRDNDGVIEITLVLNGYGGAPPEFILRYTNVTHLASENNSGVSRSDLLIDEILPHDDGVSHELAFANASITVVAEDFTAGWSGREGPKKPRDPIGKWHLDNPATQVHLMRTRPSMYFLDDRFQTAATAIRWGRDLWPNDDSHDQFQDYVSTRMIGGPSPAIWEDVIRRQVTDNSPGWDLTEEQHLTALRLMFDLLEEYFADQGYVAD